ncbi:MAG: type II toxin-antitoxin system HicB family antitoxin [Magnetococcales bacterium]|nr:type II toxin-antitoxin system HicB family antitoxin [Magnetococcales bacterium]MBF0150951.1 type II toxin-antitoxin system HicB family antitoxin [Magnetococcales bacterium]MBF0172237.1 type II toxin-antitoxin system HicB family antitoxin [Magnetococcales bacterium]MBF0346269.1 type II toxin-antitoxin system HicB family antitoxin [Magnetococcales bacterium]MBF0631548.1 type II toxin-antitoxin system HicB family antitoxin [Magnetococcales bacterium]
MADLSRYPFEVRPLGDQDGGGFLITFPDFPGCMSDGETLEETVNHGMDALKAFIAVMERHGDTIPEPGDSTYSGHFVTRVPKNVHARLAQQAKKEGVSMNAMVASILAESLGRFTREHV